MPDTDSIQGMPELLANLRKLEFSLQRKVLIEAAKAGAEIVREDAARSAPRDTGALGDGMVVKVSGRESDINEGAVDVGPDKKQFYGMFSEFGTSTQPARPFLGPALERNRERITDVIKEKLSAAIEKAVR